MIMPTKGDPTRAYAQYAAHSLIISKNNFDGSPRSPTRNLCAFENVDLSTPWGGKSLLASDKTGFIAIVETSNTGVTTQHFLKLDFNIDGVDIAGVTPADILKVLQNAIGTTLQYEAQAYNQPGRTSVNLMCKESNIFSVQVYGDLANAIGFGGGRPWVGCGAKLFDYYNDDLATGITDAATQSDGINAALMGMWSNGETSVNTSARITGDDITVTAKARYSELEDTLKNSKVSYSTGPMGRLSYARDLTNPDRGALGGFEVWIPKGLYESVGAQDLGDSHMIDIDHVFSAEFERVMPSGGAVSLTTFSFIIHAKSYTDEDGETYLQPALEHYTNPCQYLTNLANAALYAPLQSIVDITPLTAVAINSSVSVIVGGNRAWTAVTLTPSNASGFEVSFSESASGCTFVYDTTSNLIEVISGNSITASGGETITATFTNRDGGTAPTAQFVVNVTGTPS